MSEEKKQNGKPSAFALMVRSAANLPADRWSDERIGVIHKTIAPEGAGAAEVAMFLAVCARYDLDPFAKEIWLAKDKGRIIILTGRDSILKVARSNPEYLGHESGVVYEKDAFQVVQKDADVSVVHEINGFDRGPMVGAYCVARKEGHPPQLVMRRFDEYTHLHHKDNWKNYPADMLQSRVITAAHRLLYNISGMYTPEEMESGEAAESLASHDVAKKTSSRLQELKAQLAGDDPSEPEAEGEPDVLDAEYELVEDDEPELEETPQPEPDPAVGPEAETKTADPGEHAKLRGRFWALYAELGYDQDDQGQEDARRAWLNEHFDKRSFGQLSSDEIRVAIGLLEESRGPAKQKAAVEPAEVGGGMPA